MALKRSKDSGARLRAEYQLLCRFEHVGIPRVNFHGKIDGFDVLALDFLGPSLEKLLVRGCFKSPFSPAAVGFIGVQVVCLLELLHNAGYVHRDIKPENLLLGRGKLTRVVHLIDYGLTIKIGKFSQNSLVVGTPDFLSLNAHNGIGLAIGYIL